MVELVALLTDSGVGGWVAQHPHDTETKKRIDLDHEMSKILALESNIRALDSKIRAVDTKIWALESKFWALEP